MPLERPLFLKELNGGCYRASTYFLTKVITEMPTIILFPFLNGLPIYFGTGLREGGEVFMRNTFILILFKSLFNNYFYFFYSFTSLYFIIGKIKHIFKINIIIIVLLFIYKSLEMEWVY